MLPQTWYANGPLAARPLTFNERALAMGTKAEQPLQCLICDDCGPETTRTIGGGGVELLLLLLLLLVLLICCEFHCG